ncbi:MarR family winged helix-turn-helix transcriptional regulator [Pelagerythrobacter sp.]|uniref:MarR family winged helix-turn-helix transcriptional regulator n=1 Tax=Pelagerythrobacter sp. TaxID=2800702 RepID=UPI0035B49AB1
MDKNTGYLLSDAGRLLRRSFDERVRELGVTSPQARLLLNLERHPRRNQVFYADLLEIEPITLCRMVDRMEEAGLVERHPDPDDRRARLLHLTKRSSGEIARIRAALDELIETLLDGFDAAETAAFTKMLERISTNLSAPPKELAANG